MEIITMESAAYKELTAKIDLIAGYVRQSEEKKNEKAAEIWMSSKELKGMLGISTRTLQRLRDNKRISYAIFGGRLPLSRFRGGTAGKGEHLQLRRTDGGRVQTQLPVAYGRGKEEMSALDLEIFEGWMRQIMERFDRNERLLASLTGKELKEVKYLDGERLLDNQDLCELLNTSKRSIQRYRSSGTLKYRMLWHKVYYKESDVQEFLRTHFNEFEQKKGAKGGKA